MKGFKNTTKTLSGHGFAAGGTVGGVADFHSNLHGSSSVRREVPSSVEDAETGGKTPLRSGYAKGGKAEKHFHVHKHYHGGGKVKTQTKSYRSFERSVEQHAEGGHIHDDTSIPSGYPDYAKGGKAKKFIQKAIKRPGQLHRDLHVPQGQKIPRSKLNAAKHSSNPKVAQRARFAETLKGMHKATGGTINKLNAGGALYATGGTINKLAFGGRPQMPGPLPIGAGSPLGALGRMAAAPRVPMRRAMPIPGARGPMTMAKGGGVNAAKARSIAHSVVGEHVAHPAPSGHKGLGRMLGRR